MDDAEKNHSPRLKIEVGAAIAFAVVVIGSGIGLATDSSNAGAWFGFVLSALGFLLCIPALIGAVGSRSSRHNKSTVVSFPASPARSKMLSPRQRKARITSLVVYLVLDVVVVVVIILFAKDPVISVGLGLASGLGAIGLVLRIILEAKGLRRDSKDNHETQEKEGTST